MAETELGAIGAPSLSPSQTTSCLLSPVNWLVFLSVSLTGPMEQKGCHSFAAKPAHARMTAGSSCTMHRARMQASGQPMPCRPDADAMALTA